MPRAKARVKKSKNVDPEPEKSRKEKKSTTKGSKKRSTEPTTSFILSNTNASQLILAHYAPSSKRPVDVCDTNQTMPQTIIPTDDDEIPVTDLMYEKSKKYYYFLDTHKTQNKMWINMIDVLHNGVLPPSTTKACWWCRHSFNTRPIGCPLRYYSNDAPGVDRDRYLEKIEEAGLPEGDSTDFFECEGYFCSFPCCKAYILDQGSNPRYKDSASLTTLMYKTSKGEMPGPDTFPTAPTWKLLRAYGGHLAINEYRATFGKLGYEEGINVRRPYMFSSSKLIKEQRIRLFRGVKE